MTPVLQLLRSHLRHSDVVPQHYIDELLNIKDRWLYIRTKEGVNKYKIRGTIFSGFWGTYSFNTIIVATQLCHLTNNTFESLRGVVSGDDSTVFVKES